MMGIFGVVKATCSHLDLVSTVKLMTDNLKKRKEKEVKSDQRYNRDHQICTFLIP